MKPDLISEIHKQNRKLRDAKRQLEFVRRFTQEYVEELALREVHAAEAKLDELHIAYRQDLKDRGIPAY